MPTDYEHVCLAGEDRKWPVHGQIDANDPERTLSLDADQIPSYALIAPRVQLQLAPIVIGLAVPS